MYSMHAVLLPRKRTCPLSEAWAVYEKSPERATPDTIHEELSYHSTFQEFVTWIADSNKTLREITIEVAAGYAQFMRTQKIAVSTHNRKIKRLRRIFRALNEYWSGENPFQSSSLQRKEREERDQGVRRLCFTREQEQQLQTVLDDAKHKVKNKPEVRVVYYLGMFTGQRMKDCVLLRWNKINFNLKRIWVKQFKTSKKVTIPIAPKLLEVLQGASKNGENDYVCPNIAARYNKTNALGKNVGNNLVNIDMLRVIRWIGLEPSVKVPGRDRKVTVYGFHSLRHSFASYCAEAGVPQATIMSILGADSEIVNKYYTHVGDEAQRLAIAAITGDSSCKSARECFEAIKSILKENVLTAEEKINKIENTIGIN